MSLVQQYQMQQKLPQVTRNNEINNEPSSVISTITNPIHNLPANCFTGA